MRVLKEVCKLIFRPHIPRDNIPIVIVDEKMESPSMEPTRGEASTLNWGKGVAGDYFIRSSVPKISQHDFMFLSKPLILHFSFTNPRQVSVYIESRLQCVNLIYHLVEDAMWSKELSAPWKERKWTVNPTLILRTTYFIPPFRYILSVCHLPFML